MIPQTFEEAVDRILAEMRAVMIERQRKYGPENIREQGVLGVLMRARNDKMNRLHRFYEREQVREMCLAHGMPQEVLDRYLPVLSGDFADDSVEDAHLDAANYVGPIGLMLRRGWWGLPLASETNKVG